MWLIIGKNGFFANNLIRRLAYENIAHRTISVPRNSSEVDFVAFEILLRKELPEVSVVVMCSWQGIPVFSARNNAVNLKLHQVLITQASEVKDKISVYCFGSCAEYDGLSGAVNEESVGSTLSSLGHIKNKIFKYLEMMVSENLQCYWIVPFFAAGPFQRNGSLFDHICRSVGNQSKCSVSKSIHCDFVHIQDVFDVVLAVNKSSFSLNNVTRINVGSGRLVDYAELADLVPRWAQQMGAKEFHIEGVDRVPNQSDFYSSNKIRDVLIQKSPRSLEQILTDCYRSMMSAPKV